MIAYARSAGWVPRALRYEFCRPGDEPLLWLPDVVSGAVMRSLADGECQYVDLLGSGVTTVTAP
jgi:hypothetical protein